MKGSLRTRAIILVFIILSAVLGANTAFLSWQFASFEKSALHTKARLLGERLREEIKRTLDIGLPLGSLEGVSEACRQVTDNNREIGYCMVTGSDGMVLYHNDPLLAGMLLKDPASRNASAARTILIQDREDEGIEYYDVSLPVFDPEQRLVGAVRLGLKKSALDEKIYPMVWKSAMVGLITLFFAAVIVALLLNRKVLTPLVEMSGTASLIALGDWSRRLKYKTPDEIGQLADSFNRMAESIKEREERIKQNYKDLEKANDDLQRSYAKLEATAGELELQGRLLNDKVGDLSFLHDATGRLRLSIDLEDILFSIAADITGGLGYERVLIALVNEEGGLLEEKISMGMGGRERELLSESLDSDNVFIKAVRERRIQYEAQVSTDVKAASGLIDQLDLKEFAVVPMAGKDRCVGVILVDNRRSMRPLRKDKLDILATFASTAAMAIENALLYRELFRNLDTVERANTELRRLDQTKTNFLSLASHELRTPLVSVMGYLNLMVAGDLGEISAEQREMLEVAIKGASRLRDIIEDLLMVAKLESGRLPLRLQRLSVAEVVQASLYEVGPFLNQRQVSITSEGLERLPEIEADFDRLQRCFTNLLSNAVKFTPDGGSVLISGRTAGARKDFGPMEFPASVPLIPADCIEVTIQDSGIGIKKEDLESIFDKFFEAGDVDSHSTGKAKFMGGGTGLGLSIVKGIIESHSGKIWAESDGEDVDRCPGSRFHIVLPIRQPVSKPEGRAPRQRQYPARHSEKTERKNSPHV